MAYVPKYTIELTYDSGTTLWKTILTKDATAVSDGTAITVPKGTTAIPRPQDHLFKNILTMFNDLSANGV